MKYSVLIKRKKTNNNLFKKNLKNYLKNSTPKELFFDWMLPIVISFIVFTIVYSISIFPRDILKIIGQINNLALVIVPILAGFSTASLAIIASSNGFFNSAASVEPELESNKIDLKEPTLRDSSPSKKSLFRRIYNLIWNNETSDDLHTLISFFVYAIIFQLFILVIGIVISALISLSELPHFNINGIDHDLVAGLLSLLGFSWLVLLFHSIFISIRNVDLIMHYIIKNK